MEEKEQVIRNFLRFSVRWGRLTGLLGCLVVFLPCAVMYLLGISPIWSAVWAGSLAQISVSGIYYFIEPLSYAPTLGIPGTYMAFLSGNVFNLRIPSAIVAQESAGVLPGSLEGQIFSAIGVAVSIFISVLFLLVACLAGNWLIAILPAKVTDMFSYVLPAVFAAVLANSVVTNPKCACVGIPISLLLIYLQSSGRLYFMPAVLQIPFVIVGCVVGTITLSLLFFGKNTK